MSDGRGPWRGLGGAVLGVIGGAVLAAACARAPEDADTSEGFVRVTPNEELLVLPPLRARSRPAGEKGQAEEFAEGTTLSATPLTAGVWDTPRPGLRRWRLSVEREGSLSLNFGFTRYRMPQGGVLRLLDAKGGERARFTDSNNKRHGQLWTPVVQGTRATIEVTLPEAAEPLLDLALTKVSAGFVGFGDIGGAAAMRSGSCNRDVACADGEAFKNEIRSVAVISLGGDRMCTGTLLNDVAGDGKPYFLTANHCRVREGNASSLVVYWNYQTSSCGGAPDGKLDQFQTGAKLRAGRAESDFTLVELDDLPKSEHDVFWTGWDARPVAPPRAIAIHHPNTDEKRISFENDPVTFSTYLGNESPGDNTHLRIADWDIGTTEPGSSGSGLWNAEHRLVGQLHGGYAACGNEKADWYGAFSASWGLGASASERLSDWLDPAGSGTKFVDGKAQCARPTVEFSTSPNPGKIGEKVTTTANVTGGAPPYTYAWDFDGDGRADCTGASCEHAYSREFDGDVALNVVDSTGCAASLHHRQVVTDPNLCPRGFDSTDVPRPLPDQSSLASSLAIAGVGTAQDVRISLRVEHPYRADLLVSLVSPSGQEVVLTDHQGGKETDYELIDRLLPELGGKPVDGTWKLRLTDSFEGDTGALVSWRLTFRSACQR
jgi:hypothetical protein